MSNLHRGPSIDVSYQVSVHLAKIKMWKVNVRQAMDARWWQKTHIAFGKVRAKKKYNFILN
jgi:hypothetical protein